MTPDQLTGRALDEAAARAMGWTIETDDSGVDGDIHDAEGKWRGPTKSRGCHDCGRGGTGWPTERDLREWLHKLGEVEAYSNSNGASAAMWLYSVQGTTPTERGNDLREALARLVVAVKQREDAKA